METKNYAGLLLWKTADESSLAKARAVIAEVVNDNCETLVGVFYDALLHHPEGADFLNRSIVQERLSHSLHAWLQRLVDTDLRADVSEFAALQARVGAIHARMKIPNHLVLQGASLLKSTVGCSIAARERDANVTTTALILLDELFDFAINLMSEAYVDDTRDRAKVDEAFRLFNLGQDINLERETQRASLMEWSQGILFSLLGTREQAGARSLASSPFGLWLRHRAAMLFQGSPIIETIEQLITRIDQECLPAIIESGTRSRDALKLFQDGIEEIMFLLNDMFQRAANVENGRDPLTRALNRRFLPSVLVREIALAQRNNLPLTVAMIDVDHFKSINDRFGHSTGDLVLGYVAEEILSAVRSSDFVFRYGGEEFLVMFAETDLPEATRVAERLRQKLADQSFQIPDQGAIALTVSIGVASFEGHPDYEYLIRRADEALYQAKNSGRDRVVVASEAVVA